MKTKIIAFALAGVAATTLACNDSKFLTETPIDFVGPGNFYNNATDALAAVNGAYAGLENTSGSNYYGGLFPMLVEFTTEMQTPYLSAGNERSLVDNYTFTPSHNYIYQSWLGAYSIINRANGVIARVPGITMDATLRDRIVGEARFLRALNYFNLVRLFGGVPLETVETTSLDSLQKPRATTAEVYALIIQDLTDAIKVLPKASTYGSSDVGRASRGAAKSLLAKVYIQRAGAGGGAATDYQSALTLLQDVDASEGYSLVSNISDLFDTKHEVNPEVIFDIQCTRITGAGCHVSNQVAPRNSNYGSSQNGSFTAEQPFFDEFALTDKRRATTWQLSFINKSGAVIAWAATQTASGTYGADTPYMHKFLDSLSTSDDETNYIIQRYADNLLLESEAINEISGPTAAAYAPLNAVRARAGLPAMIAGLSKAAFRDSVFHERRLELTMEGPNGYFDSQRNWDWAKTRIEASMALGAANKFKNSKYPKAQTSLVDKFKLMPIPQRAIDINPALAGHQNPGW
ncbi:MAG: RagB/SusD protein [Gemmatimonadetes bacterium]|nr:RagB/SusD protein [Gemmatimonadota bacterium]